MQVCKDTTNSGALWLVRITVDLSKALIYFDATFEYSGPVYQSGFRMGNVLYPEEYRAVRLVKGW